MASKIWVDSCLGGVCFIFTTSNANARAAALGRAPGTSEVNFIADGLPAATRFRVQNKDTNDGEDYTMTLPNGFPLGVEKDGQYYLYNHVRIWMQSLFRRS